MKKIMIFVTLMLLFSAKAKIFAQCSGPSGYLTVNNHNSSDTFYFGVIAHDGQSCSYSPGCSSSELITIGSYLMGTGVILQSSSYTWSDITCLNPGGGTCTGGLIANLEWQGPSGLGSTYACTNQGGGWDAFNVIYTSGSTACFVWVGGPMNCRSAMSSAYLTCSGDWVYCTGPDACGDYTIDIY